MHIDTALDPYYQIFQPVYLHLEQRQQPLVGSF